MISSKKDACSLKHSLKEDIIHIDSLVRLHRPRKIQDSRSRQFRPFADVGKEESPTDKYKEQVRSRLRHRYSRMRSLRDLGGETPMDKEAVTLPSGIPTNLLLKKPLHKQRSEPVLVKRTLRKQKSEPALVKQKSRIQPRNDNGVDCGDGRAPPKKTIMGSVPCGTDSGKQTSEELLIKQKSDSALVKSKTRFQAKNDSGVDCSDGRAPSKNVSMGGVHCDADSEQKKSEEVLMKQKSDSALVKPKSRITAKKDFRVNFGDGCAPSKKAIMRSVSCGADSGEQKSEAVLRKQKSEPALIKPKSDVQGKKDKVVDCDDGNSSVAKGIMGSVPCPPDIDKDSSKVINPNTTLVVDQNGKTHIKPKYSLKKKLDIDCLVGLRNIQAGITDIDEDASLLDDGVLQFSIKKTKEMKKQEYWHQDMLT